MRLGWAIVVTGLLGFQGAFVAGMGDDGAWSVLDEADDQAWVSQGIPDQDPPSHVAPWADIRKVTMGGEDEVGFGIDVEVEDMSVAAVTYTYDFACPSNIGSQPDAYERLVVEFEAAGGYRYRTVTTLFVQSLYGAGERTLQTTWTCLVRLEDGAPRTPHQRAIATLDGDKDRIHVWIPKRSLLGQNGFSNAAPDPELWPPDVPMGTRIENVRVVTEAPLSWVQSFPLVPKSTYVDVAPNAGDSPVFTFTHPVANAVLKARFEDGRPRLPVGAATNQTADLWITNGADAKRLVSLEYALSGPEDRRGFYEVFGPSRVTLPAGETRRLQVALRVAPEARPGDNVTVEVRARSAGAPGEIGYAAALMVPGPILDPANNVLYLQAAPSSACTPHRPGECSYPFLSALKQDPQATSDDRLRSGGTESDFHTYTMWQRAETWGDGTPLPIRFDPAKPAVLQLVFDSMRALDEASLEADLEAFNATQTLTVAHLVGTGEVTTPTSTLEAEGTVKKGALVLTRGWNFRLTVRLTAPLDPQSVLWYWDGLVVHARESYVRLPILEPPPELMRIAPTSALQLDVQGSRDDFVNPGKTRLFNLTLLNQGGAVETVTFAARPDTNTWTTRFEPAHQYVLQPGDTIRIGLFVTAPPEAAESEHVRVLVNASTAGGQRLEVPIHVTAITTLDFSDDAGAYRPDADAVQKAVKPPTQNTPAGSWAAPAGVLALTAWWARRRT